MNIDYIYNSGVIIEFENTILLFDYFKDDKNIFFEKIKNKKNLYVFVSHNHFDHYNKRIFEFKNLTLNTKYILSYDVDYNNDDIFKLNKFDIYKDDLIYVKAYGSTDAGISFYLEVQNKKIFHAGDLNNWHWNEEASKEYIKIYEESYKKELNDITKDIKKLDLLMFPIDPRLGKDFSKGFKQFTENIKVKNFLPIHFKENYGFIDNFFKENGNSNINFLKPSFENLI